MIANTALPRSSRWFEPDTLVRSIGIGIFVTLVSRLAALGRTAVFVRQMDRAELGTWAISNNTVQLLSIVLVLGIPAGVCRYVERYQREGRLRWFLTHVTGASFGLGLLACLLGVIFCKPLAHLLYEDASRTSLTILTCLCALSLIASNFVQGVLQGMRVYRINAWMILVQSVGFALLGSVLLVFWRADAVAGAWSFLIVTVAVSAFPAWLLWRHVRAEPASTANRDTARMWRHILTFSLATWGTGSLVTLNRLLDRYMLIHTSSLGAEQCLRQIGAYHIVETLTAPLLALGGLLSTLMLPHAVHLWEARRDRETGQMIQLGTKLTVLGLTLIGAGLVVLKRFVLVDIFGDVTMESSEILEVVLVTTIVLGGYHTVRSYMLCSERPIALTAVWLGGLGLNVVLNLVLIPRFQVKGAAIACLISSAVSTAIVMGLTHRAGLRLAGSTWAACSLPLVLLAPPSHMLGVLALAAGLVIWTDWLLSAEDKSQLNRWLAERFSSQGAVRQALA